MRRVPALAVSLVLATAAVAGAAPARGVTFADPAGDADGVDGRAAAASQPAFDVVRVRLAPHERTAKGSGIAVTLTLAGAPSTAPGSTYFLKGTLGSCAFTAWRTFTTDGVGDSANFDCGSAGGLTHKGSGSGITPVPGARTLTFKVPAAWLTGRGTTLTGVEAGTATGEPAVGVATGPSIDVARYAKAYRIGS